MSTSIEKAAEWFAGRAKNTPMPGARAMFEMAVTALFEKSNREAKPQTNADRIRAMSDEELEVFLINVDLDKDMPFTTDWGKWLKQPAQEDQ